MTCSRAKRLVAVVTPIYKAELTADEEISLRHLRRFLGNYDRIIVAPAGLTVEFPDCEVKRFPRQYFSSIAGYNRLLLSKRFYSAFQDYEFILIYQLDCLVLADKLKEWCEAGWSYVGAPWLVDWRTKALPEDELWAVGNGGFSLRRIPSFLKVFSSKRVIEDADDYSRRDYSSLRFERKAAAAPNWLLKKIGMTNNLPWRLRRYTGNEDLFWGMEAARYEPDFRVPPAQVALSFAFEFDPAFSFKKNGNQLPFGCHAWAKYDRSFWKPYLI